MQRQTPVNRDNRTGCPLEDSRLGTRCGPRDRPLAPSRLAGHFLGRVQSPLLIVASILSVLAPAVLGQILDPSWMARAKLPEIATLLNIGEDLTETDAQGRTALHYAATNEDAEITDLLLRYGADPDATDFMGSTPLHLAAAGNRNHLVVETLVRFGADFAARDVSGRTPLEVATISNANSSVADSLRELASTSESLSDVPISRLIHSDWPNSVMIDRLRARPAFSDDTEVRLESPEMQELFKRVLQHNRDPSVSEFLVERGAGLELEGSRLLHALHLAALNSNPAVAGALLDLEVSVNVTDGTGQSALHYAATNPNPAVATLLLERGAEADAEDGSGRRPLHMAALNPNPAVARLLLERGAAVDAEDRDGGRALHAAALNPNPAVAGLLLERGADIGGRNADGLTALDLAVSFGNSKVMELLIDRTASGDSIPEYLFIAIGEQSHSSVADLLARNGDVPRQLLDIYLRFSLLNPDVRVPQLFLDKGAAVAPVRLAALNPNPAVVELLLERGAEVNAEDANERRALHEAVLNPNPAVAAVLLDRGAEVDAADSGGRQALHWAALNPNPAVVRLLLERGAGIAAQDDAGRTALHEAALNPNPAVAELLLDRGANVDAEDSNGRRALHVAALNPNPAVAGLLLERGAEVDAEDGGQATPLLLAWLNSRSAVPARLLEGGAAQSVLNDRLLDVEWVASATSAQLLAQVANALPSGLLQTDDCGRSPIHLVAHFAARNNIDPRIGELDPLVSHADIERFDHFNGGLRALLERGASVHAVDGTGNSVLHYAVSGAAKVASASDGQAFPSAGMGLLQELRRLGADFRARGAARLWPVHYAQPGRAFESGTNSRLASAISELFGTSGNVDPATGSASGSFEPSTDSCVLIGASADRTAPAELLAGNGATPAGFQQPAVPPATNAGESWTNSLGMEFVSVPAGSFVMGSPADEVGRDSDERQREVRISQGFWMGKYEVTRGEWEAVMGSDPSGYYWTRDTQLPVSQVYFSELLEFIRRLNERESASGYVYRLPTEAEWEYAARAGTTGPRYGELDEIAWYGSGPKPVGEKRANAWGLHDMLGNAAEWTADWYGEYPRGSVTDPQGPPIGHAKVIRGGNLSEYDSHEFRAANRDIFEPSSYAYFTGFRLVRAAPAARGSTGGPDDHGITVAAGTGFVGFSGDGGPAKQASLMGAAGIAVDRAGNLFIASSSVVRRVDATTGIITTVAGTVPDHPVVYSEEVELARTYGLDEVSGYFLHAGARKLFKYRLPSDSNSVQLVDPRTDTEITTVDVIDRPTSNGDGGPANQAWMTPMGVTVDGAGNLYIADVFLEELEDGLRIRRVDAATGLISTVAGGGSARDDEKIGGPAIQARFRSFGGSFNHMTVDGAGNLYIADEGDDYVLKVDAATGIIASVAGTGDYVFSGDGGPATEAGLRSPEGVSVDSAGNLYFSSERDRRVRRVDASTGIISTVAGTGRKGLGGDSGPATQASLCSPEDVSVDSAGNLYILDVADSGSDCRGGRDRVRRVDAATGNIRTVASGGRAIEVDSSGNLYIAHGTWIEWVARDALESAR